MSIFTASTPPPEPAPHLRHGTVRSTVDAHHAGAIGAVPIHRRLGDGGERRLARWLRLHHGDGGGTVAIVGADTSLDVTFWAERVASVLAEMGCGTLFVDLSRPDLREPARPGVAEVASGAASLLEVADVVAGIPLATVSPGAEFTSALEGLERVLDDLPSDVELVIVVPPLHDPDGAATVARAVGGAVVLGSIGVTRLADLDRAVKTLSSYTAVDVALVEPDPALLRLSGAPLPIPAEEADVVGAETIEAHDDPAGPRVPSVPLEWRGVVQPAVSREHSVSADDVWTRTEERD